jgi:hypothetical protein
MLRDGCEAKVNHVFEADIRGLHPHQSSVLRKMVAHCISSADRP